MARFYGSSIQQNMARVRAIQAQEEKERAAKAESSKFNLGSALMPAIAALVAAPFTGGTSLAQPLAMGAAGEAARAGTAGDPAAQALATGAVSSVFSNMEKAKALKAAKAQQDFENQLKLSKDFTPTAQGQPTLSQAQAQGIPGVTMPSPERTQRGFQPIQTAVGERAVPGGSEIPTGNIPAQTPENAINMFGKDWTRKPEMGWKEQQDYKKGLSPEKGIKSKARPTMQAGKDMQWVPTGKYPDGSFRWEAKSTRASQDINITLPN